MQLPQDSTKCAHQWVYITAADEAEARMLAQTLVEERLAACANLLGSIESIYWWDGAIQNETEQALVLKTTDDRVDALVERAVELHSYDCPCVVALPITKGNPSFLDWLQSQTR